MEQGEDQTTTAQGARTIGVEASFTTLSNAIVFN